MKIKITDKQVKKIIKEAPSTFPIGNDNFNVGYDSEGLGRGVKPKVLDRNDSIQNSDYSRKHKGIDIFAPEGTPAVASISGEVLNSGRNGKGGNTVTIGDGTFSYYYAHLKSPSHLKNGQRISAGDLVGYVGKTGNAQGTHPHLHYSQYYTSKGYRRGNVDPWPGLKATIGNVENLVPGDYSPSTTSTKSRPEGVIVMRGDGMGRRPDEEVRKLQKLLVDKGYILPRFGIDGKFGPETENTVKAFQKDHMGEVTGMINKEMVEKLEEVGVTFMNPNPQTNDPTQVKKLIQGGDIGKWSPNVVDALNKAAQTHGIPADILFTIANIESGGNPAAVNKRSRASGLFQILPRYYKTYGVTSTSVWDPYVNADAAASKLKEKYTKLTTFLGRPPIPYELYLAHNQGMAGFEVIKTACESFGELKTSKEGKHALQQAAISLGRGKRFGSKVYRNMKGNKGDTPCRFLKGWNDVYASRQISSTSDLI